MVTIIRYCPFCNTATEISVTNSEYSRLTGGKEYIQDIFKHMSPEDREVLISGICKTCQDKIF